MIVDILLVMILYRRRYSLELNVISDRLSISGHSLLPNVIESYVTVFT
jgi:hypothetical protein